MNVVKKTILIGDLSSSAAETPLLASSAAQLPAQKGKNTRYRWNNEEDMLLLKQYQTTVEVFSGKETETWQNIHQNTLSVRVGVVTVRAARDHRNDLIREFEILNSLDEWRSDDPGTFTESRSCYATYWRL